LQRLGGGLQGLAARLERLEGGGIEFVAASRKARADRFEVFSEQAGIEHLWCSLGGMCIVRAGRRRTTRIGNGSSGARPPAALAALAGFLVALAQEGELLPDLHLEPTRDGPVPVGLLHAFGEI